MMIGTTGAAALFVLGYVLGYSARWMHGGLSRWVRRS